MHSQKKKPGTEKVLVSTWLEGERNFGFDSLKSRLKHDKQEKGIVDLGWSLAAKAPPPPPPSINIGTQRASQMTRKVFVMHVKSTPLSTLVAEFEPQIQMDFIKLQQVPNIQSIPNIKSGSSHFLNALIRQISVDISIRHRDA